MTNTSGPDGEKGIQPLKWQSALPRREYRSYRRVSVSADSGWYEVYLVLPGIYAICEPGHFQEVISFLISGGKQALLWDTGMGIAPIRPVAESLTKLPIVAVNSHNHFDHVGGNHEFSTVFSRLTQGGETRAAVGYGHDFLAPMMGDDSLAKPLPAGFVADAYVVRPWKASALCPGFTFDLGGRWLEVLFTPGHSPDSIMLLDRAAGVLFTGDTIYPAALYAHFDDAEYGKSSLTDYAETLFAIRELSRVISNLCCSHNVPVNPPSLLPDTAEGFQQILAGRSAGVSIGDGLIRHNFRGFSIITR